MAGHNRQAVGAADRHEIAETLQSYALACDVKDFATLRSLFADDAAAKYDADPWLNGRHKIVEWLEFATKGVFYSQHAITPVRIEVEGDAAEAIGYLTSYQRIDEAPDELVMMNSRYDWKLRRTDVGWQISQLVLEVGWFEKRDVVQPRDGIRTTGEGH